MESDNEGDSISRSGKSFSGPGFLRKDFIEELDDDDGKTESTHFPPTFFMELPSELKLVILDSVSGVDIAKVSCVCSELRNLASSDDLWKQKYVAQFRNDQKEDSGSESGFKERFAKAWEARKSGGGEGLCLINGMMRRNGFNYVFGEDDEDEWLNIARLCMGIGVPRLRNGMPM